MGAGANASTDDPRPAVLAVARDEFRHRGMHDGARNAGLSVSQLLPLPGRSYSR
jgi:hypothetical protein